MNFKVFFWEADYILFDGAIGTQIYSRGIPKGHCYDELNISLPETIIDIHQDYISAGAKVITTNTFGANRFILEEYFALGEKTREINYYGARLAKQAAKNKAFVAGSIGPISRPLDTEKRISSQEIKDILEEQIEALLEGGVDLIIFETFACLDELTLAVQTANSIDKNLFTIAEISFPNSGLTLFGRNPYEVGLALESTAADTIGSNCGTGPQNVLESIKKMGSVTKKPLSAMPNAGLAQFIRGKFYYPHNPEYFAIYGKKFLNAGVRILGGCCGTTPEHIRLLNSQLKGLKPKQRKMRAIDIGKPIEVRKEEKVTSRLKQRLQEGGVLAIELDPPKDPNFEIFLRSIESLSKSIEVITVSDCPMARARMSPISAGSLLKKYLGKEIIVHYTCRDRNILGIQADLLGAAALGLENFLALGGDPPSIGDYPFATGVYDLTSTGLVEMISALNHGVDILGNPLGEPTHFFIGIGMGSSTKDIEMAIEKIKKGAHFIITQPIFDLELARKNLSLLQQKGIPVIASILPLVSFRNAEYIHYEVPGISIPEELLHRMEKTKAREGEKEGILIAREIFKELKSLANGILFMPPLGKFYLVEEILS